MDIWMVATTDSKDRIESWATVARSVGSDAETLIDPLTWINTCPAEALALCRKPNESVRNRVEVSSRASRQRCGSMADVMTRLVARVATSLAMCETARSEARRSRSEKASAVGVDAMAELVPEARASEESCRRSGRAVRASEELARLACSGLGKLCYCPSSCR
jgi:hypothetical protein